MLKLRIQRRSSRMPTGQLGASEYRSPDSNSLPDWTLRNDADIHRLDFRRAAHNSVRFQGELIVLRHDSTEYGPVQTGPGRDNRSRQPNLQRNDAAGDVSGSERSHRDMSNLDGLLVDTCTTD